MSDGPEDSGQKWTAGQAQSYLQLNGGFVDGRPLWHPDILFQIDMRAEEHFFLMPDGITGRTALMKAQPFDAVGQTPERVFEKLGFLCDESDGTIELHTARELHELRATLSPGSDVVESKNLWRAGEGWENFRSLVGTVRGFTNALALTDGSDFGRASEDKQIKVFMRGMAKMSGLLLADAPEGERGADAPQKTTAPSRVGEGLGAVVIEELPRVLTKVLGSALAGLVGNDHTVAAFVHAAGLMEGL